MGRNPPSHAGVNGTSPEIPYTVDADPYATAGKAAAVARQGKSAPASTGALAVGTPGREVHGTGRSFRRRGQVPRALIPRASGGAVRSGGTSDRPILPWKRGNARGGKGPTDQRIVRRRMAGTQRPSPRSPWSRTSRPGVGELVRRARCGKSARRVPWGGAGVTRRSTRHTMTPTVRHHLRCCGCCPAARDPVGLCHGRPSRTAGDSVGWGTRAMTVISDSLRGCCHSGNLVESLPTS